MIMYGRGAASVGEQIGASAEEAQKLIDSFFESFPKIKKWVAESQEAARKYGYVEDLWGRRRRLPDIQLPQYTIKLTNQKSETCQAANFNPLLGSLGKIEKQRNPLLIKYEEAVTKCRSRRDVEALQAQALKEGITIQSNGWFISQAERQCVNCVDRGTQILTQAGWKSVDQLVVGEPIYSLNIETGKIESDTIKNIFQYSGDFTGIRIKHSGFDAISTPEHKWPTYSRTNDKITLVETKMLSKYKNYGCRKLIRSANNDFKGNPGWSLDALYILGMLLTDGSCYRINNKYESSNRFNCTLYQKKEHIKETIRQHLQAAGIQYTERTEADGYSCFYLKQPLATQWGQQFPHRHLTHEFINSLSQQQAKALFEGMQDGDGYSGTYLCVNSKEEVDLLQHLIVVMGKSSTYTCVNNVGKRNYSDKISNKEGFIETKKPYYVVNMLKRDHADVLATNCTEEALDFVWCVETGNHTWIARSEAGYTFITGNSRIQGSAASMSKRALIKICQDPLMQQWKFQPLILVHDEIIGECPEEYIDQVSERLSELMKHAAEPECVVPFKVDATVTTCWYEEEYYDDLQEEYDKLKEGSSQEEAIENILAKHIEITKEDFLNHIKI